MEKGAIFDSEQKYTNSSYLIKDDFTNSIIEIPFAPKIQIFDKKRKNHKNINNDIYDKNK